MKKGSIKELNAVQHQELMHSLKARFVKHMDRHKGLQWDAVEKKLEMSPHKLWSLNQMEETGGEPDVVEQEPKTGSFIFYDCAAETPKKRRSICYDGKALEARKEFKPATSAIEMANAMGIEILTEEQYRKLQGLGHFDTKTSSWLKTPEEIRKLGGALFGDHRFGGVFIYHNGAQSYYAGRGFRGWLSV
jgi:hypothetical protein